MASAISKSASEPDASISSTVSSGSPVTKESSPEDLYVKYKIVSAKMQAIKATTFDYIGYDTTNRALVVRIPKYNSYFIYYSFPPDKFEAFITSERPDIYWTC